MMCFHDAHWGLAFLYIGLYIHPSRMMHIASMRILVWDSMLLGGLCPSSSLTPPPALLHEYHRLTLAVSVIPVSNATHVLPNRPHLLKLQTGMGKAILCHILKSFLQCDFQRRKKGCKNIFSVTYTLPCQACLILP